jgi:hypothetical protein
MTHRIGAILYILWGALHLIAARATYALGGTLEPGLVQGRVYQDAWNLAFFALFAIVVAIIFNWKNSRTGYWLNLVVVSAADIGFIVHLLIPGHVPLIPGIAGPVLWVLAMIFSTIGIYGKKQGPGGQSIGS